MRDYDAYGFDSKAGVLERSEQYWNPDKTRFWAESGIDLVIDQREGYRVWDMDGRQLWPAK